MREIKFRAWNKESENMSSHNDMRGITPKIVEMYSQHSAETVPAILLPVNQKHVVLMQYTGLKDKNGVEIYEGDIVRCWGGECHYGVWEYNEQIVIDDLIIDCYGMGHSEFLEVIGNIYEKAELQEGNNE